MRWLLAGILSFMTSPLLADVLYSTSFDGPAGTMPTGWSTLVGSAGSPGWRIAPSGSYVFDQTGANGISNYGVLTGLTDFVVETTLHKGSTGGFIGVVGRFQNTSNFYHARLNGVDKLDIYKWVGNTPTVLATTTIPSGQQYMSGETWKLQMVFFHDTIAARLYDETGQKVAQVRVNDTSHASGTSGVRGGGGAVASWDDFLVRDVPTRTIKTSDGNGADALVESISYATYRANCNSGGLETMEIKNNGPDPNNNGYTIIRKAYLRFDLSSLSGGDVDAAVLRLTSDENSSSQTFNLYGLNDGDMGENWIEGTGVRLNVTTDGDSSNDNWLRWTNAPANMEGNAIDSSRTTLLTQFQGAANGAAVEIAGGMLRDFINADTDGLVTFIVTRETHAEKYDDPNHDFRAKEFLDVDDAFAPALILVPEMQPVPEPTAWLLLIIGSFGVAWLRSRATGAA